MSEDDRLKWDERYASGSYGDRSHPTGLLADWESRLPRGRALDLACGAGRNSLFLAAAGWQVEAVDISPAGLRRARQSAAERALQVNWIEADLEEHASLPRGPYELVVLVRYVNRSLVPLLPGRLSPGGVLLCEQHVDSEEDVIGPRNPAWRLRRNELLRDVVNAGVPGLRVLYYREGRVADPDGRPAALAQVIARLDARSDQ